MRRRTFLAALASLAAAPAGADEPLPTVTVAMSPSCGCCTAWVAHMRAAGFPVRVQTVAQARLIALKRRIGLRAAQASCHTATVAGYVVEGHVPAGDVTRLLAERPRARGLTVPGMPVGSPGMEIGARRDPYDTLLIAEDGTTRIFARHR